jgi:hypothetical protein
MITFWVHWKDTEHPEISRFTTLACSEENAWEIYNQNKMIQSRYDWEISQYNSITLTNKIIFKEAVHQNGI